MKLMGLLSAVVLLACSMGRTTGQSPKYETLAYSRFGERTKIVLNESRSYALCVQTFEQDENLVSALIVVSVESGEILLEDSIARGRVRWDDDHTVRVTKEFGMVTKDGGKGSETYVYDVVTRSKNSDSN